LITTTERAAESRPGSLGHSIRGSRAWVVAAAAVPAALYLLYVSYYAVNVPFVDDWQVIPVVTSALHGHIVVADLWSQWSDAREVTGRLVFIAFGFIDQLDERAVLLFSAILFIVTYALVLRLFRSYLGRRLTPLPVFLMGVVWFSLVDWEQALWSSTVYNYLTLFFVVLAMYFLLVRQDHPRLFLGLGVAAAVLASLSFIEGFLVWPVGLICLLWSSKWKKTEMATWVIAATLTTVTYFHGYSSADNGCAGTHAQCSLTFGLTHPDRLVHFLILLVGNTLPLTATGIEAHLWVHTLQGAVLLFAAVLVIVQTIREGRGQPYPLPLLLIVFALSFDLVIAVSRVGLGLQSAVSASLGRYSMPNLILVVAIVIYAWAHAPKFQKRFGLRLVGFGVLIAFLVVQCVAGTAEGISDGHLFYQEHVTSARIVVNLNEIAPSELGCYIQYAETTGWYPGVLPWFELAKQDHLSIFQDISERQYRAEGLPLVPHCRALRSQVVHGSDKG